MAYPATIAPALACRQAYTGPASRSKWPRAAVVLVQTTRKYPTFEAIGMTKGMNAKKNSMKKPAMTLKEKRAAKHEKKEHSHSMSMADLTTPAKGKHA